MTSWSVTISWVPSRDIREITSTSTSMLLTAVASRAPVSSFNHATGRMNLTILAAEGQTEEQALAVARAEVRRAVKAAGLGFMWEVTATARDLDGLSPEEERRVEELRQAIDRMHAANPAHNAHLN